MSQNVHFSSQTDLWYTPDWLFDRLDQEFEFDLDVCALPSNAKCKRFFAPPGFPIHAEDCQPAGFNGLKQNWGGYSCWMNPPYGRSIRQWVSLAHSYGLDWQHGLFQARRVVCLLPARVDTSWWWDFCIRGEIRFLPGRLKFGGAANSAPFPSAVVIFERGRSASVQWWAVKP